MADKLTLHDYKSGMFEWGVPVLGIQHALPIQLIPQNALYDARNVILKDNNLVPRPGMLEFASTILEGIPTGFFSTASLASGAFQADAFQQDAFQVSSGPGTFLIVGTTRKVYVFFGSTFNDITGTTFAARNDQPARFTGIQLGTPPVLNLLHANGVDPLRVWDSVSATMSLVSGSPPVFSDITTIGDRIVGIIPPYDIRWSPVLNIGSWPSTNIRVLADSSDKLIGISNLGLNGGVVYKAQSIWNAVLTGSVTESQALRFDFKREVEGPAGPAAIVNAGAHYYMTPRGRIARWDFFNHSWVADGVWPIIREHIDTDSVSKICGSYNPLLDMITFFYARVGDNGENKGRVDVLLPNMQRGIETHIAFVGEMGHGVSATADSRLDPIKRQYLGSSTDNRIYTADGLLDAGESYEGYFQTGLPNSKKAQPARINSIEVFAERGPGYGQLIFKPVTSYILDKAGGTVSAYSAAVDLSKENAVFDVKGANARGRFVGARFEFKTPLTLYYKGALMTVVDRDM